MARTDTSKIILCKNIKLDREYKNVLDYTEQQMLALCRANKVNSSSERTRLFIYKTTEHYTN